LRLEVDGERVSREGLAAVECGDGAVLDHEEV
jgi:hypothetical protein